MITFFLFICFNQFSPTEQFYIPSNTTVPNSFSYKPELGGQGVDTAANIESALDLGTKLLYPILCLANSPAAIVALVDGSIISMRGLVLEISVACFRTW